MNQSSSKKEQQITDVIGIGRHHRKKNNHTSSRYRTLLCSTSSYNIKREKQNHWNQNKRKHNRPRLPSCGPKTKAPQPLRNDRRISNTLRYIHQPTVRDYWSTKHVTTATVHSKVLFDFDWPASTQSSHFQCIDVHRVGPSYYGKKHHNLYTAIAAYPTHSDTSTAEQFVNMDRPSMIQRQLFKCSYLTYRLLSSYVGITKNLLSNT